MRDLTNKFISVFSFDSKSITPEVLAKIIQFGIGFNPTYLYTGSNKIRSGKCNINRRIDDIKKSDDISHFELKTEQYETCPWFIKSASPTYDFIRMIFEEDQFPSLDFFDFLSTIQGFNFGFIEEYEFNFWQNEKDIDTYITMGKMHDNLPKISNGFPPPLEKEVVDITINPAREIKYPGMILSLSPKMWLGNQALQLFNDEILNGQKYFISSRKIDEKVLFLQLTEDYKPTSSELKKIRDLAKKIDLDYLETSGEDMIRKSPVDAIYEINFPIIDGEKCREQVVWLGPDDKPTNESKATRKLVNIFDSNGKRKEYFSVNVTRNA